MNVLVIMCDHHRHDALGCLGNSIVHTPNLDRLAAESIRFGECYTQSPVCAPARHSLATGQYAHRHGVLNNGYMPFPGMRTIAHALEPLDYRRQCVGHMHWTDLEMDHGYERYVTQQEWLETMPAAALARWEAEHAGPIRRTTAGPSSRTKEQYSGHYVATQTIQFMKDTANKGEQFLCWAAFSEPHPPFYPPREFYEPIDHDEIVLPDRIPEEAGPAHPEVRRKRDEWKHLTDVERKQMIAGYYGMIALVDSYIGRLLDTVEELGIQDDTLVIWTSDHGDQMWENELYLKFIMREGATHVPLLMRIPGRDAQVREELVEHIDLFPTICDLVGAETPEHVQGRSLIPLLDGARDWRDAVFSQIGHTQMIRTVDWELNVYGGEPGELFDLRSDRQEHDNRIGDPACSAIVEGLFERLRAWERANAPEGSPELRPVTRTIS